MDGVRDGIIGAGVWHPSCSFSGASWTRFLAHIYDDVAASLIFVGRISDFEDVHIDALWESLRMPSSEKSTNACDVQVTDEDCFLSRCVGLACYSSLELNLHLEYCR